MACWPEAEMACWREAGKGLMACWPEAEQKAENLVASVANRLFTRIA